MSRIISHLLPTTKLIAQFNSAYLRTLRTATDPFSLTVPKPYLTFKLPLKMKGGEAPLIPICCSTSLNIYLILQEIADSYQSISGIFFDHLNILLQMYDLRVFH